MKAAVSIIFAIIFGLLLANSCSVIYNLNDDYGLSAFLLLLIFVLPGVLTLVISKMLSYSKKPFAARQRTSPLVSVALVWGLIVLSGLFFNPFGNDVSRIFSSFLGLLISFIIIFWSAIIGGVIASGLERGFWEDNHPPSEIIRDEVELAHLKYFGSALKGNAGKSTFDRSFAFLMIILLSPLWFAITFMIWFEDPGPVLFIKNSVTRNGYNFRQFKFRTMSPDAEAETGPVYAAEEDARVLRFGKLLRKTALDELPQLLNILRGEMSFVGPRPQRTVLVHNYLNTLPEFAERHSVLPGIAGLAQVVGDYYITPRQKLRLDRIYIQNMSLGFDIKLLLLSFLVTLWYRWKSDWNGRIPRGFLRFGSDW